MLVKVIFNIPQDELDLLITESKLLGITTTELIRRAVKNQLFISNIKKENGKLFVKDNTGETFELIIS